MRDRILEGRAGKTGGDPASNKSVENADPDDLHRYKYEELTDPGQIRVLQLHTTKGDAIDLELKPVQHSDGGYQALSYVWGSEDKPFRATVRDGTGTAVGYIPLTVSLADALHDLRDSDEVTNKMFWIDQICINQQGDEKNHQVAIMGDIFRNAAGVITYLGPAGDEEVEENTIALLDRIHKHFSPNSDMLFESGSMSTAFAKRASFPVTTLPTDLLEEMAACEAGRWTLDDAASRKWLHLTALAFGDWAQRLWSVTVRLAYYAL
jgi:hypothetical protein